MNLKKLLIILPLIGLFFASCEKEDAFLDDQNLKRGGPPSHANAGGNDSGTTSDNNNANNDFNGETPLIAGQHYEVGTVKVEFDNGNIIVTYETKDGWFITETHLHISEDENDFPTNTPGNPMIGLFKYGNDHEFKEVDNNKVIYTIPWDASCFYIAAHAVVVNTSEEGDFINLEAFAASLPETATISIEYPYSGGPAYFPEVDVTNADFLNGKYLGWCINTDQIILDNENYHGTRVYSSYDEDIPIYKADFLMKLNWIINENFVGKDAGEELGKYTYGDVQIAIWTLFHEIVFHEEYTLEDWLKDLRGYGTDPLNPTYIGDKYIGPEYEKNRNRIKEILNQADEITDFVPECGGVIAIVLIDDDHQDLIIEYPFPCYQDETAWGQGCRFVERGNWAMYFKVCL